MLEPYVTALLALGISLYGQARWNARVIREKRTQLLVPPGRAD